MLFYASVNQLIYLIILVLSGYLLARVRIVPDNAGQVLSRMENYIFLPALILHTFASHFTVSRLSSSYRLLLLSLALALVFIGLACICSRFCAKDRYTRNIYCYGLSFSNFGFMGNAVVSALFPDIFLEYILFTLVLWILIYLWGVPALLMDDSSDRSFRRRLRNLFNPMFVGMLIGVVIGLTGIRFPAFLDALLAQAGGCMSPVAMLLTGITIAGIDVSRVVKTGSIYIVTALRLIVFPLLFLGCAAALGLTGDSTFLICGVCSLAMPLGLNTIIIPSSLGKDTSVAAGMALISHLLSALTIPLVFLLLEMVI